MSDHVAMSGHPAIPKDATIPILRTGTKGNGTWRRCLTVEHSLGTMPPKRRKVGMRRFGWLLALSVLVACGGESPTTTTNPAREEFGWGVYAEAFQITTPNGRTIECVAYEADAGGGITCDWGWR